MGQRRLWGRVWDAACQKLIFRDNRSLHHRALRLYPDILTVIEAGIASQSDKPSTGQGATKADVEEWKRKDEHLQPWLYLKADFVSIFTQA